ncbi:Carotenoid cleavage dioxygenase 8-like protein B, chloroplastic [Dichanthelium oligosanthes]|uniref:Carotenoid cleavage dioxygenase 8-like protein B, chloroplastic n=1 Tax=Dichanthelium oligosanthes TaxID=888268 RepID=A0A1E5UPH0_9POAL|nr:Carotenoid cleavage dioxygenase 8-like protein B, chloroplastic [Dichanthelium oligosanthes]
MASYPHTLCTAANPSSSSSLYASISPPQQPNHQQIISAKPHRLRISRRCMAVAAAGDDCGGAKHSAAWTSTWRERWQGGLANGTYLRNGPGVWEVGDHAFHHVFDGYATLLRISIRGALGRATGAHRQIDSDAYRAARAHCTVMSDNANTAVVPLGDGRVVCLADVTKS